METPNNSAPENRDQEKDKLFIRTLNDILRTSFVGGTVLITSGIKMLAPETRKRVIQAVQTFDNFTPECDPYEEHDFGQVDVDGEKVFFKIDYYDVSMRYAAEDPSDAKNTKRVLTIMLASEY